MIPKILRYSFLQPLNLKFSLNSNSGQGNRRQADAGGGRDDFVLRRAYRVLRWRKYKTRPNRPAAEGIQVKIVGPRQRHSGICAMLREGLRLNIED